MTARVTLAVLGGGSPWTPSLLFELGRLRQASRLVVRLFGPSPEHLTAVSEFASETLGAGPKVVPAPSLETAVEGAGIVLDQARIGGWDGRLADETLPVRFGCLGDESLGIGGLRAALRARTFVEHAAPVLADRAPGAWVLALANPSDLRARLWREHGGRRVLALCEQSLVIAETLALASGCPCAAARFGFTGTNHVGWLVPPPELPLDVLFSARPDLARWYQTWGAFPTPARAGLGTPTVDRDRPLTPRAEVLRRLSARMMDAIRRHDRERYEVLLAERRPVWYARLVVPVVASLAGLGGGRAVVGCPAGGRFETLHPDVFVEGWAGVGDAGIRPEPLPDLRGCRDDVEGYGQSRDLAFRTVMSPGDVNATQWLRADPFACPAGDRDRVLTWLRSSWTGAEAETADRCGEDPS